MFAGCGEQVPATLQNHGKASGMENFCRVRAETIETLATFRPVTKILPTKRPPFWGPETDHKMEATHSVSI